MVRVIVVGGGIAGLAAARELVRRGHCVVVLEAQSSLGGRVKSVVSEDADGRRVYDLGASWFHDSRNNVLYDEAVRQQWPTQFDGERMQMFRKRAAAPRAPPGVGDDPEFEEIPGFFETLRVCDDIPAALGCDDASVHDTSLRAYAQSRLSPDEALPIKAYEHFCGLNWDDLSAVETPPHLLEHGEDAFQLGGNQILLVDWLYRSCISALHASPTASLHIVRNAPVHSITQQEVRDSAGKIRCEIAVAAAPRVWRCDRAIVTASLGYLRHHHETLFPARGCALPRALRHAMSNGTMACLAKAVFEFATPFWSPQLRRAEIFGDRTGAGPAIFVTNAYRLAPGPAALVVLAAPPLSLLLEREPDAAWREIGPLLRAIAEPGARVEAPRRTWVSDWSLNPWTRGSYSALSAGQNMRDFVLPMMEGAWGGRLLFAGEHTTIHGAGCMDGAYVSGIRAAQQADELGDR